MKGQNTVNTASESPFFLWFIPLILTIGGIVSIYAMSGFETGVLWWKQFVWALISAAGFMAVVMTPLRVWKRCAVILLGLSFCMMSLTLVGPLRVSVNGAARWIHLGFFNFQPLELVSFALLICLSGCFNSCDNKFLGAGAVIFALALPAIMTMFQPDFGGLLLLVTLAGAMYIERYGWELPLAAACGVVPALCLIGREGYRADRIATWLNPWADPLGAGYQVIQGLIAFANGHVWGIGLGRAQQFLPEIHNDFIFPAIGEQCGFAGTSVIVILFFAWTFVAHKVYRKAEPEKRGLIWGITIAVLMPFFINLGGVMKLIPLSGMPLPFISYGGTSLLFMWARVGLLVRCVIEQDYE